MAWAPKYITTGELRPYVRLTDNSESIYLDLAVEAASRAVDRFCNRQFGSTASVEQRTFEVMWSPKYGRYRTRVDDIATDTGLVVTVSGSTLSASDYTLLPRDADLKGRPWTQVLTSSATRPTLGTGPRTIAVDATFGWSAVPDTIKQAVLLQASRFFADRHAVFGIAGTPEFGTEMRLLARVNPDVELMLLPYRRDRPMVG